MIFFSETCSMTGIAVLRRTPLRPWEYLRAARHAVLAVGATMCLALCLASGVDAQTTAPAAPEVAAAPVRYGTVLRIRGAVTAVQGNSHNGRTLAVGDVLFVGERIVADANAEALVKTDDAGYFALRSGADFVAERFSAKGNGSDQFVLRIFTGALRVVTGWIGHTNRMGARIHTPSATIGIRGTDHEPFVLSAELASQLSQMPGTYDKVNRGGTTLDSRGNVLDLDPGKVGFVRSTRTRGLLTMLLPVLLDKIPEFYVPGQFDAELDGLSEQAQEKSLQELELQRARPVPAGTVGADPEARPATDQPTQTPATQPLASATANAATVPVQCNANAIARNWITRFDAAVVRRDAEVVRAMFVPEALIHAKILLKDGATTELDFTRDELVQSAIAALDGLTEYVQRRPLVQGVQVDAGACNRVEITSVSIEQGKQQGRPYRFEALETYSLEWRFGVWLAVKASTAQR